MPIELIDTGTSPDSDGDTLRAGADKINRNFIKCHDVVEIASGSTGDVTIDQGTVGDRKIIVNNRNAPITISGVTIGSDMLVEVIYTGSRWQMLSSTGL